MCPSRLSSSRKVAYSRHPVVADHSVRLVGMRMRISSLTPAVRSPAVWEIPVEPAAAIGGPVPRDWQCDRPAAHLGFPFARVATPAEIVAAVLERLNPSSKMGTAGLDPI